MKATGNPSKTNTVGKRPAIFARLLYRIIEVNLHGDTLQHMYEQYHLAEQVDDLLSADKLFSSMFIDEKYWLNLLVFAHRPDVLGPRAPVLMAPYHKAETAGPVAALMMTVPTIRDFIEPMCRYQPALDPSLIMGNEKTKDGIKLTMHYDALEGDVAQAFIYCGMYLLEDTMVRMTLWQGDPEPKITVNAPQPSYFEEIRNLFYSKIFWQPAPNRPGSGWSIEIPDALLDIPNYCANPAIFSSVMDQLDGLIKARAVWAAAGIEKGETGGPQTEMVRTMLSTALTLLSQAQVADQSQCEPRTLQKRLQREGSSWSELVTDEFKRRTELAVVRGEPCKALATRMGMTESNFYRKFQKLYGATPKEWVLSQQERTTEEKIESVRQAARKMRR
jgi:AraC-like DNA-binding protein